MSCRHEVMWIVDTCIAQRIKHMLEITNNTNWMQYDFQPSLDEQWHVLLFFLWLCHSLYIALQSSAITRYNDQISKIFCKKKSTINLTNWIFLRSVNLKNMLCVQYYFYYFEMFKIFFIDIGNSSKYFFLYYSSKMNAFE